MPLQQGRPSPLRPWCISPLFQISPIFEKNFDFLKFYLVPTKFHIFIRQNFWRPFFLSHRPQISNFPPVLPVLLHFPLIRENLLFHPTFQNLPPVFEKFNSFLHTLRVIFPPTLTMMHLCITQCTYWTPLHRKMLVCHYQSTVLALYHQHSITFQTRRSIPLMQLHGVQTLRNYDVTGFVKVIVARIKSLTL